jgi:hypothetical protein
MKLIPLDFRFKGADDDEKEDNFMAEAMNQALGKIECEFTTNELGVVQRIDNWRTIRDEAKKFIKFMCDSLYTTDPDMESIMPRKQFENLLLLNFSTEEGVRENYEELENLFGLHGSMFDIGDKEEDTEEQGYPEHTLFSAGYTPIEDEENDFDGDYAFSTISTTTIPVEDMMDLGLGVLSMIVSDMANDSLEAVRDQIIDSLKIAKPNGIEITVKEYYGFFLNGWPKEYYYGKKVDLGISQSIETDHIEWISRHWNIYIRDEESTENNNI